MHNIDGNQAIKSATIGGIETKVLEENSNESKSGKILTNLMKPWQSSKTTCFHSGVDKVVRFLEGDEWR
jgi:hypothetical protein